jgi:hypothetical protein
MDEQAKAAFAGAADSSKLLITLATGLLGLEITFAKDVVITLTHPGKILVGISWALFLLSVVAGLWTLLALTGNLGGDTVPTAKAIYGSNVKFPAVTQILLFLAGLGCTVAFGLSNSF